MQSEDFEKIFARITPDDALREKTLKRIEEKTMKKSFVKHSRRAVLIAAAIAAICVTTAFAAGSVISYFNSDKASDLSDVEQLYRYNREIGLSDTKGGYTLTLDNVAADDNFIHVFYTLTSETPLDQSSATAFGIDGLWIECIIDGSAVSYGNNCRYDGYFEDEYTYKCGNKYNVAARDIPESFSAELVATKDDAVLSRFYVVNETPTPLTDAEKENLLYVSTEINKSDAKIETTVREINQSFNFGNSANGEIVKAILSPFGNQLIVSDRDGGESASILSGCAMFDENGQSLDILNTVISGAGEGDKSINTLEFLKADEETEKLTIVPLEYHDHGALDTITIPFSSFPLTFETSDYGKIVVTNVRFADGVVSVDYYKDGFSLYDPAFFLLDETGNEIDFGGKLACTHYTDIHNSTNSYTARYVYENYDQEGNLIPLPENLTRENLERTLAALGTFKDDYFSLDYDNAVTINLK